MRVTINTLQQQWLAAMQRQQAELLHTQKQVSTGRRVLSPADDPFASVRALGIEQVIESLGQYQRNAVIASNRLALEEQVLVNVGNTLQRVRDLAVQANNGPLSEGDRQAIAVEVAELLDSLVQTANSKDGEGHYLFSGYRADTTPFSYSGASVIYNGDQGQRLLQIGSDRKIADGNNGDEVFMQIRNGNGTFSVAAAPANVGTGIIGASGIVDLNAWVPDTYTVTFTTPTDYEVRDSSAALVTTGVYVPGQQTAQSISFNGIDFILQGDPAAGDVFDVATSANQDLFTTVQKFINALGLPAFDATSRTVLSNEIGSVLTDLDQALDNVLDFRASIGSRLNAIASQQAVNDDLDLSLRDSLSQIRDLDYAEALSRLELQAFGLEAAQASFARVQNLSLFSFLR